MPQVDSIQDNLYATLRNLGRNRWTELGTRLQQYPTFMRLWKNGNVKKGTTGRSIQWNIRTAVPSSTTHVRLYEPVSVSLVDVMKECEAPWRHVNSNFPMEEREMAMNSGTDERLFSLIEERRTGCLIDHADKIETAAWQAPPSSSDDLQPMGIPYSVVQNATTGFNGGAPTGHTSVYGLSPTTYAQWKNYTFTYAAVSDNDLLLSIKTAKRKTNWVIPVDVPTYGSDSPYAYFCGDSLYGQLELLLSYRNDNLGTDLGKYHDVVGLYGVPVQYTPQLDSAFSNNPIYGLNLSELRCEFLSGMFMKLSTERPDGMPLAILSHYNSSYNWVNKNRRAHFVGYAA